MREKIQQQSCLEKSGTQDNMGIFPPSETGSFTCPHPIHRKKRNCGEETDGGRGIHSETVETSKPLERFNMTMPFVFILRLYQKIISPWIFPCCRFTPSCSQYAISALEKHGVLKGSALAVWRLLRCQPFCRGGYDPVPDNFTLKRNDCTEKLVFSTPNN